MASAVAGLIDIQMDPRQTTDERRQQVSQALHHCASKVDEFMTNTMREPQTFQEDTYYAISLYASPRDLIRTKSDYKVDDNFEAEASDKADTKIKYDMRGRALKSICYNMRFVFRETGKDLASSRLTAVQEKALFSCLLELRQIGEECDSEKDDWHKAFQKIVPCFIRLHNTGLFQTNPGYSIFASCRPITLVK